MTSPLCSAREALEELSVKIEKQVPVTRSYLVKGGLDDHFTDILLSHYLDFVREAREALASSPPAETEEGVRKDIGQIADLIVRDVCELPDRTSPDDWPEAMLVTGEELHALIVERFADAALSRGEADEPVHDMHGGYGQCCGSGRVWVDDGEASNWYERGSCPRCAPVTHHPSAGAPSREALSKVVHESLCKQDVMKYLEGDFDAGIVADAIRALYPTPPVPALKASSGEDHIPRAVPQSTISEGWRPTRPIIGWDISRYGEGFPASLTLTSPADARAFATWAATLPGPLDTLEGEKA